MGQKQSFPKSQRRSDQTPGLDLNDLSVLLNALNEAVLLLDQRAFIHYANHAAEQLLQNSSAMLKGAALSDFVIESSPICALIEQSRRFNSPASEEEIPLQSPRIGHHQVSAKVTPIPELPGFFLLSIHQGTIAQRIQRQNSRRNAARSLTAMGAILAHEIKNPLSGIRGAAQLLEGNASRDDRLLTRLICDEADRIVKLVDRMEALADQGPIEKEAVNIHEVLSHVQLLATNGFARHVSFVENYDPSLPDVWGNRDLLIQVFLNLVKNAAEALPRKGGAIALETRYQQGMRKVSPGGGEGTELPLQILVADNGPGIPKDLIRDLFDPFVTTKQSGSGLGLAMVAKALEALDGVIEVSSSPGHTVFQINFPRIPNPPFKQRERIA